MRYKLALALILALIALAMPIGSFSHSSTKTTLAVGVFCIPLGRNRLECHADVTGGTSPYSFQWSPTPLSGGGSEGLAIIACSGNGFKTIGVNVTDSLGDTGSFSGPFQCCGSCDPL